MMRGVVPRLASLSPAELLLFDDWDRLLLVVDWDLLLFVALLRILAMNTLARDLDGA